MTAAFPLWIGIAVAFVYLPMSDNPPSLIRSAVKTLPLVAFAIAAWIAGAHWLLVLALALSAIGDLALSRRGEAAFLAGLSAFALAHIAYAMVFLGISGAPIWSAFVSQPLLALFLVFVTLSTEIWLAPYAGRLRWPVRFYAVVITVMGLAALTSPLGALTLGAGYFVASDVFLAFQLFRMDEDNPLLGRVSWLIWGLYVAGQALILSGALG